MNSFTKKSHKKNSGIDHKKSNLKLFMRQLSLFLLSCVILTSFHYNKNILLNLSNIAFAKENNNESGYIVIRNHTVIPLTVKTTQKTTQKTIVNPRVLAEIAPSRSQKITVPQGSHNFEVYRMDGSRYSIGTLKVRSKNITKWDIFPIEATLEIENKTLQKVSIFVDNQMLSEIGIGASTRIDGIRPGSRWLKAVDAKGNLISNQIAELPIRSTYYWMVRPNENSAGKIPTLNIRNFSGETVKIFVNKTYRITLYPGDTAALGGIKAGITNLEAKTLNGITLVKERIQIEQSSSPTWEIAGSTGKKAVLEVSNKTTEIIRVCVDGSFCIRLLPNSTKQYDAIKPGRHTFQAYEISSEKLIDALEAELSTISVYSWEIEPVLQKNIKYIPETTKELFKENHKDNDSGNNNSTKTDNSSNSSNTTVSPSTEIDFEKSSN